MVACEGVNIDLHDATGSNTAIQSRTAQPTASPIGRLFRQITEPFTQLHPLGALAEKLVDGAAHDRKGPEKYQVVKLPVRHFTREDSDAFEGGSFTFEQAPKASQNLGRKIISASKLDCLEDHIETVSSKFPRSTEISECRKEGTCLQGVEEKPLEFCSNDGTTSRNEINSENQEKSQIPTLASSGTESKPIALDSDDGLKNLASKLGGDSIHFTNGRSTQQSESSKIATGQEPMQNITPASTCNIGRPERSDLAPPFIAQPVHTRNLIFAGKIKHKGESGNISRPVSSCSTISRTISNERVRHDPTRFRSYTPARVSKVRRGSELASTTQAGTGEHPCIDYNSVPSQEDLVDILLFRMQQDKKLHDEAMSIRRTREVELRQMRSTCSSLEAQVVDLQAREEAKNAEIDKYRRALPGWKIKVRKFEEYLKGLTNDYHKLRDDANSIRDEQDSLNADSSIIKGSLKGAWEIHEILQHERAETKQAVEEARIHINEAGRKLEFQEIKMKEHVDLLRDERKRSQTLELNVSKISTTQQQILQLVSDQRLVFMHKLDTVLESSRVSADNSTSNQEQHIKSLLQECLTLLRQLQQIKVAKPEDIQQLKYFIGTYATSLTEALESSTGTARVCQLQQDKIGTTLQAQLDSLSAGIETQQTLSNQISDLQRVEATIRERLQISESSLADARELILQHQKKEEVLSQELSHLKTEILVLRERPRECPVTVLRLQELESRNILLEGELSEMHARVLRQDEQNKCSEESSVELQNAIDALKSQLQDAEVAVKVLHEQKSACEAQADARYQSLKGQLLRAGNAERALLAREHKKEVEHLQYQKNLEEARVQRLRVDVESVRSLEAEGSARLRLENDSLETAVGSARKRIAVVEEKHRLVEEDLQSKCAEIQNLRENIESLHRGSAEAKKEQTSRNTETESWKNSVLVKINSTCQAFDDNFYRHEDIEHALEGLVVLLHNAKLNKHALAERVVNLQCKESPNYCNTASQTTPEQASQALRQEYAFVLASQPSEDGSMLLGDDTELQEPLKSVATEGPIIDDSQDPSCLTDARKQVEDGPSIEESQELPYSRGRQAKAGLLIESQELPYGQASQTNVRYLSEELQESPGVNPKILTLEANETLVARNIPGQSSQQSFASPAKPKRKVDKNNIRVSVQSSINRRRQVVVKESQLEETTIHRTCKRTTTSHGHDTESTERVTPSRAIDCPSVIRSFSQIGQGVLSAGEESPMTDVEALFPSTPYRPSVESTKNATDGLRDNQAPSDQLLRTVSPSNQRGITPSVQVLPIRSPAVGSKKRLGNAIQMPLGHSPPGTEQVSLMRTATHALKNENSSTSHSITSQQSQVERKTEETRVTSFPKSILKDTRKRSATSADLDEKSKNKRKATLVEKQGLGPIIPDSQSPTQILKAEKTKGIARKIVRRPSKGRCSNPVRETLLMIL